jgi:hypothetical protein
MPGFQRAVSPALWFKNAASALVPQLVGAFVSDEFTPFSRMIDGSSVEWVPAGLRLPGGILFW